MSGVRLILNDHQWDRMEPHLAGKRSDPGRTGADNRLFVEAVLWLARTGSPWRDLPEFFGATWGTIRARSARDFRTLIAQFVDFYAEHLLNPNWGEHVMLGSDNTLKISMVSQGLDKSQVRAVWRPFFDSVRGQAQAFAVIEELGAGVMPARYWWDDSVNR